jgi:hypothetical protein
VQIFNHVHKEARPEIRPAIRRGREENMPLSFPVAPIEDGRVVTDTVLIKRLDNELVVG